jgi:transcriptional regulator with XRE-family HTH domain
MSSASERLKKLVEKEPSKWVEKAKWRIANEKWLDKSAKIALAILRTIRDRNISQKDLAEMLNISPQQVNKILKGQENLTLETIDKFETILGISLSVTPMFQTTVKSTPDKVYTPPNYHTSVKVCQILPYKQMQEPFVCAMANDDSNRRKIA